MMAIPAAATLSAKEESVKKELAKEKLIETGSVKERSTEKELARERLMTTGWAKG